MALVIMSLKRFSKPEPMGKIQLEKHADKLEAQLVVPNFLHDPESFWWLHLWTMLRVDHPKSSIFSSSLFKNNTEPSLRRGMALTQGVEGDLVRCLHGSLMPLASSCNVPRGVIYQEYLKYDALLPLPLFGEAPDLLMELCNISIEHAKESDHPIPNLMPFTSLVPDQPLAVVEERPTSQSSDEDDGSTSWPAASDQVKSAGKMAKN